MQEATEEHDKAEGGPDEDKKETRPQQGGEGGTTRFGMEDGDNTDVPATGSPASEEDAPEHSS
jgi:hypothetical protein